MINIIQVTEFFGWCSIINMGILGVTTLFMTAFSGFIINIHSKMMNVDASEIPKLYFKYLANYKIGVLIFNLVPYIVLKIMA